MAPSPRSYFKSPLSSHTLTNKSRPPPPPICSIAALFSSLLSLFININLSRQLFFSNQFSVHFSLRIRQLLQSTQIECSSDERARQSVDESDERVVSGGGLLGGKDFSFCFLPMRFLVDRSLTWVDIS